MNIAARLDRLEREAPRRHRVVYEAELLAEIAPAESVAWEARIAEAGPRDALLATQARHDAWLDGMAGRVEALARSRWPNDDLILVAERHHAEPSAPDGD